MREHVVGFALMAVGAGSIVIGFLRVCGSLTLAEMLACIISAGIGGLVLLGAGAVLRSSAHLHDEWRTIEAVHAMVATRHDTNGSKRSS
jgi:hypothetical protein